MEANTGACISTEHADRAAATIVVWQVLLALHVGPAVGAYAEAFNHQPEWLQDEDKWRWSYRYSDQTGSYTAELYGWIDGGTDVHWEFYGSRDGGFQDFLWFSGTSNSANTIAQWTMNIDRSGSTTPLLQADWHRNTDGTGGVQFTNVEPGSAEHGGFINYGLTNQAFNSFYNVFVAGSGSTTNIELNSSTNEGRILEPDFFNDAEWHCWDANLCDDTCQ